MDAGSQSNGSKAPFDNEFLDRTPAVNAIERAFTVNALSSPEVIPYKQHLFLDEKIVIVGIDVIRCATTACAVLASRAKAMRFYGKQTPLIEQMFVDVDALRTQAIECTTIGEFAGRPIPGGVASNSPQLITSEMVQGKHVLFLTKNLGDLCCGVTKIITEERSRWHGEMIVGCLMNFERVVAAIQEMRPQRIVLCCGGFRKTESLEDQYFGGQLIKALGIEEARCDDVALSMIAIAEKFPTVDALRNALASSRVKHVLEHFGMSDDIEASLSGAGIDPFLLSRMKETVPVLAWSGAEHWFIPYQPLRQV